VADKLGVPREKYATSFQSRLGADAWLKPYTAERLRQLPKEGVKKLVIVCPAFVSDCLETIEEIGKEGREIFMKAGGESFVLIPCMNTHPLWIGAMRKIIAPYILGKEEVVSDNQCDVPVH
jgi:ferrochelatase